MPRPKITFDDKTIEQIKVFARCHCPDNEIAIFAGCSEATLKRRFSKILHEERAKGVANLRAKQYQMAMLGDKTMLIWVGKQIAGQTEKVREDKHFNSAKIAIHRFVDKDVYETLSSPIKKDDPPAPKE